jgi:hypothetical protein
VTLALALAPAPAAALTTAALGTTGVDPPLEAVGDGTPAPLAAAFRVLGPSRPGTGSDTVRAEATVPAADLSLP